MPLKFASFDISGNLGKSENQRFETDIFWLNLVYGPVAIYDIFNNVDKLCKPLHCANWYRTYNWNANEF